MSQGRRGSAQHGGRTENTGPGVSEGQVCDSTQAITENSASPLSARLWSTTNGTCAENTGHKLHSLPLSSTGEPDLVSLFLLAHGEGGRPPGPLWLHTGHRARTRSHALARLCHSSCCSSRVQQGCLHCGCLRFHASRCCMDYS